MTDPSNPYYVAYLREKKTRQEVEQLLEQSTRELYEKNLLLQEQMLQSQQQQQSVIYQEKMATIGTLAAGVAHEINNPLAFIMSNIATLNDYSKILLRSQFDNDAHTHLELIRQDIPELIAETHEGLCRIKEIVKSLLFFARTDTDDLAEIQLQEAIEFSLKILEPMLFPFTLRLEFAEVPKIFFRANELHQVLLNILLNAIQACEGRPDFSPEITIQLSTVENEILLQIADNGCGMSEETKQKIFEAFYTTKAAGEGTGVGMSIVKQILQSHHCRISVQSELNRGTAIAIYFPLVCNLVRK